MNQLSDEELNKVVEEERKLSELIKFISKTEEATMDIKVISFYNDFCDSIEKLLSKGPYPLKDEYGLALISFLQQGIELIKDLDKKIENKEV
jgi:hypothetical protein